MPTPLLNSRAKNRSNLFTAGKLLTLLLCIGSCAIFLSRTLRSLSAPRENSVSPAIIKITGSCKYHINGDWALDESVEVATGRPFYRHLGSRGSILYYDPSCDGTARGGPRFIFDQVGDDVDLRRENDIDNDSECNYMSHFDTNLTAKVLPEGNISLHTTCNNVWIDETVQVTHSEGKDVAVLSLHRPLPFPICEDVFFENTDGCNWIIWNWSVWRKLAMKCNGRPTYTDKEGRFAYVSTDARGHWWTISSRTFNKHLVQERFKSCSWEARFIQPAHRDSNGLEDTKPDKWQQWFRLQKYWLPVPSPLVAVCLPNSLHGCIDGDCEFLGECSFGDCAFLKQIGECEEESDYMNTCCKKVCDNQSEETQCLNHHPECENLASLGKCQSHQTYMTSVCPLACGDCDPCSGVTCSEPPNECHVQVGVCSYGNCTYLYVSQGIPCDSGFGSCDGRGICRDIWIAPIYRIMAVVQVRMQIWIYRAALPFACCLCCFFVLALSSIYVLGSSTALSYMKLILSQPVNFTWFIFSLPSFVFKSRATEQVPTTESGGGESQLEAIMKKGNLDMFLSLMLEDGHNIDTAIGLSDEVLAAKYGMRDGHIQRYRKLFAKENARGGSDQDEFWMPFDPYQKPRVIVSYCTQTANGTGERLCWKLHRRIQDELSVPVFNGTQIPCGSNNWMVEYLNKMADADIFIALLSKEYAQSNTCSHELYEALVRQQNFQSKKLAIIPVVCGHGFTTDALNLDKAKKRFVAQKFRTNYIPRTGYLIQHDFDRHFKVLRDRLREELVQSICE